MTRFCFMLLGGAALTMAPMLAADGPGAAEKKPAQMTSVVRSDQRTGKLVRSVVVTSKPVAEKRVGETVVSPRVVGGEPEKPETSQTTAAKPAYGAGIDEVVARVAAQESLPPQLLHSVIKVESNYDPMAISPKGALGLMQLIPSTAQRFGVNNAFNPAENIQGGAKYLRYLLELYNGNYPLALAAYNAGEGAVARYGGVPPYAETRNYLIQVGKQLEKLIPAGKAQPKPVETKPAEAKEDKSDGVTHVQEIVQPDGTVRYVSGK